MGHYYGVQHVCNNRGRKRVSSCLAAASGHRVRTNHTQSVLICVHVPEFRLEIRVLAPESQARVRASVRIFASPGEGPRGLGDILSFPDGAVPGPLLPYLCSSFLVHLYLRIC
jgi:hypothetical protein